MTRYSNYVMKNNVFAELDAPISSLATTIQLKTGQGARRGTTFPILATLESFDSNGKCTKREIVRITAVNGDNLTVVRGVAPCPSSDDSNTQGTSTYSFQADDKISLYITKEHFDNIEAGFENTNAEIDDIYANGDHRVRAFATTGLGIKVCAGNIKVGNIDYQFPETTATVNDNTDNYVMISDSGTLNISTDGRDNKQVKVAIVTASNGEITNIDNWKIDTIGGEAGSIIGEETYIAGETITKGDIVAVKDFLAGHGTTCEFGTSINTKFAMRVFGNGISGKNIYLRLAKVGNGNTINVRIETDDNGVPSGTLVDGNAISTISSSSIPTISIKTHIELNGNITLSLGTTYRIVLSTSSIDDNNYLTVGCNSARGDVKTYYNGTRDNQRFNQSIASKSIYLGQGSAQSGLARNFYFTAKKNATITGIRPRSTSTSYTVYVYDITSGSTLLTQFACPSSSTLVSVNIPIINGHSYRIYENSGTGTIYTANSITANNYIDLMTGETSVFGGSNQNFTIRIEEFQVSVGTKLTADVYGDIFSPFLLRKVNTSDINTFADIIGIAKANGTIGQQIAIATNGGIVDNSLWDFIPGKDYYFTNNTIANTAGNRDTKIYLGKVVNKNSIKVDIKQYFTLSGNTNYICPFTGKIVNVENYQGGITVDNSTYYGNIIPVMKGQTIRPSYDYYAIIKDR